MKHSNIESILELQKHNLQKMLAVLKRHQQAIIKNDMKIIEEAIISEEVLLQNIQKIENEKIQIIEELNEQYSLHLIKPSLTNLLIAVRNNEEFDFDNLQKLQMVIKNATVEITRVNWQNKVLIENAKAIIRSTVNALVGQNNKQLLDRRL